MAQNLALEIKVINRYVSKDKRDRYVQFVVSAKNRKKFIADLHHGQFLQAGTFTRVTGIEEDVIRQALTRLGLPSTCYLISDNARLDTHTLELGEALRAVVGGGLGTLLVFGDADLVYAELEGFGNRFISKPGK
jgi:hypothetical protein